MSAIRRPLLCAFAGGCLSNAVLFGLWRTTDGAGASSAQPRTHHVVEVVASAAPSVYPSSERLTPHAAERERTVEEPAPTEAEPAPTGSAVSDVLTQLEAAYRERVSAQAPVQASTLGHSSAAPSDAIAPVEPVPSVAAQPVSAQPVAQVIPVVTPAVTVVPRSVAPAELALAAPAVALPALAIQDPAPAAQVHYGDVNQNTYNITNIRQGDVYLIQMQQLAMLQYMQLLGMSSNLAAPARQVGGGHQRGTLSSGITNPDNPWGFHFSPLNLVR